MDYDKCKRLSFKLQFTLVKLLLTDLKDFKGLPLKFWSQGDGKNGEEKVWREDGIVVVDRFKAYILLYGDA